MTPILWECEDCGDEFEDHPLAMAPHFCEACEDRAAVEGEEARLSQGLG